MSVVLLSIIQEIRDPEKYRKYAERARPVVEAHGGEYLLTSDDVMPLSGQQKPERVVMIRFPSRKHFDTCFLSASYRTVAPLREESIISQAVLIEES